MSQALTLYRAPDDEPASAPDDGAYPEDRLATLHTKLVRWFEEAEMSRQDERALSQRDRDYIDGDQWTTAERAALKARNQPEITINYCRRKHDLLCGLERKARTDPKAFPRTPTEEDRADAATQALRFIADDCNMPVVRSAVYSNLLVEGFGGVELGLEDDGQGGANVTITHIPWDRIWYDPHSRAPDFSDARYKGMVTWFDEDQMDDLYPDAADVIADSFASTTGYYDDRPGNVVWTDNQRKRCRVSTCHWTEKGIWWEATYSKAGFLVKPSKSLLKDRHGKSACRMELQAAYIDRENRRYGMVRDLISLQDELNKRRSKALHLLSVHQVIMDQGAVDDIDKLRREVARPDGVIVANPGFKLEIENGGDLAAGQFQLLQHATAEMQASGPNASMAGTDPRELSGRAILAQQAGGAAQNEPLADSLRMWTRRVMEMAWMAAREFWSPGKWVRVTDDLGATRWVGINRAVTLRDELAEMPEQQRAMVMQRLQLVPGDPRLEQVIRTENDISDLEVDIVIEEGVDVPAQAAEDFQSLIQMAGLQPGSIPLDVLIAASSLRNKDDLLGRLKEHMEQQKQKEQQQAPLMQRHAEATVAGLEAKAAADAALAKERGAATVAHIHGMHSEFAAPPYGQPFAGADAPPDPPSAPGTVGPEMMASHASGGLVTRTLRSEPTGWMSGLPDYNATDPRFRQFGAMTDSRDDIGMHYEGDHPMGHNFMRPPDFVEPPTSHAAGGPIVGMTGGDPPGPDDGFITAKAGEYVLNRGAVARYGQGLLDAINAGQIDPKVLAMAADHAAAELRAKHRQADVHEATALHKLAQTHATMHPQPKATP